MKKLGVSPGEIVYLDHNATTFMDRDTICAMADWCNRGNPSSHYRSANAVRDVMDKFRGFIATKCGFTLADYDPEKDYSRDSDDKYVVIFTSGASESNNLLVRSVVESYNYNVGEKPHIVLGATEHKSILECARHLEVLGFVELSLVPPDPLGFIRAEAVERLLKPNTALITVMHANNETGCMNEIENIGVLAHSKSIPFHTDAVQAFGKYPVNPIRCNVDAFSVSFHKCGGPPGVGALVVRRKFLHGWRLCACISGSQNYHLRGGTENTPGIIASYAALKTTWTDRLAKNKRMLELKKKIMEGILATGLPCKTYREYLETERGVGKKYAIEVVFISTQEKTYLPNTLMLSLVKRDKSAPHVCNVEMKKRLEEAGIIVSIGSACATSSPKASHVLYAMNVDENIRKGVMRVSIGDDTTDDDIKKFVTEYAKIAEYFNKPK